MTGGAFALLGLALNAGVAVGGALSEGFSAHAAFLLASGCALACGLAAAGSLRRR